MYVLLNATGAHGDKQKSDFRFPGERAVRFAPKFPKAKSHIPVAEWLGGKMKVIDELQRK